MMRAELTAEQIRQARQRAEMEAFKRFGEQLRLKQMPKWFQIRDKVAK